MPIPDWVKNWVKGVERWLNRLQTVSWLLDAGLYGVAGAAAIMTPALFLGVPLWKLSLLVLVGACIGIWLRRKSFRTPAGYILLRDAAKKCYDDLRHARAPRAQKADDWSPDENGRHKYMARCISEEGGIDIYGRKVDSPQVFEPISKHRMASLMFADGGATLKELGADSPCYTHLAVKKEKFDELLAFYLVFTPHSS